MNALRSLLLFASFVSTLAAQSGFVNFESALVHPIRVSPDGRRLFVANAPNAMLEVCDGARPRRRHRP